MEENIKFTCYYSWCAREFRSKYNLKRHINTRHLFLRAFVCNICNKQLVSKQNLIEHRFIHTGEKPYACRVPGCNKKYRQLSQLSAHAQLPFSIENGYVQLEPIDFQMDLEKKASACGEASPHQLPSISEERKIMQNNSRLGSNF
ncbi:unnamed protein product [Blepharisma stoltei]|uniref:C2H2-type domain-containing protein n=1 Tax=Blepharisma stoltei TaxID=1481888 RepID=A0AAU9IU10_9CILI|nr:unnamed protein product [Blepharisma stoltei]